MSDTEIVECGSEGCPSVMFTEVLTFAKIPAVVSQTGKAGIAPVGSTYICMNCGTDISETEAVKSLSEEKSALVL